MSVTSLEILGASCSVAIKRLLFLSAMAVGNKKDINVSECKRRQILEVAREKISIPLERPSRNRRLGAQQNFIVTYQPRPLVYVTIRGHI